jgi:AcrR family transcriptional regulator
MVVMVNTDVIPEPGSTGDRLLTSAMRLFARKGLAATTVGEIESEAGMAPRSGALYKYFDSKSALLEVGLERHLATVAEIGGQLGLRPLGDLHAELTLLGHWLLDELELERDVTHVMEREGSELAELRDKMRVGVSDRGYLVGSMMIGRWRPDLSEADRNALAVVGIGALINFRRSSWTFGRTPLGLSREAIVESWVQVWSLFLQTKPTEAAIKQVKKTKRGRTS